MPVRFNYGTGRPGTACRLPGTADFQAKGDELQKKANDAGCSDSEMQSLLKARIGSLESDSEFGQLIIDGIQQEGFFGA